MASGGIVTLNEEQLRKLAKLIYYQEVQSINDIQFHSESELAQYLRDSKSSYQSVLDVLDAGGDVKVKFQDDTTKASIAHDAAETLLYGVNLALQSVRNFTMRLNYLNKIGEHSVETLKQLELLDAADAINIGRLAKEAAQYKEAMLRYTKRYQSLPSKLFSWFIEQNTTPAELIRSYQTELGLLGPFRDLEDAQKLQVFNKILAASGEGEAIMTGIEVVSGAAGLAVLLLTAGFMVWDVISSHDKIQTAARDAVSIISPVGGTMIGSFLTATLEVELVGLIEVSSLVLSVTGFVAGILAGAIIAGIGYYLLDFIFGAGGSTTNPHPPPPLATDGHRFYRAQMPDGSVLARQIAHQN